MAKLEDVILRDIELNRPAPDVAGMLFYNLTSNQLERANGAAWEVCEPSDLLLDHSARHEFLGPDQVSIADLSGVAADPQTPAAHTLDGATHTIAGKTTGQFLRATAGDAFAFESIAFSKGGAYLSPGGARNVCIWQAPFACTVTNVRGYRVGGTGATVNARRNGADNHLAAAVSLVAADTWTDGGAVQNTAYVAGDKLEIMLVSIAGSPTEITIQVDFTRP